MATQRFYDGQPGPDIRRELNNFEAILDGTVAAAQDASTAATSASVKAQQWADAAPGVEVETGKYSAKHWAAWAQTTVTGGLIYRGSHSAASGTFPATPSLGDYYKISAAGTLGGVEYSVGDSIIYNGTDWDKIDSTDSVTSVAGRAGAVVLTKGDVGLGNVDNTSDANKPISSATQAALNAKVDKVAGKQLSTEDYTAAEKSKLAGVAAGAQVNTVTSVAGKTGGVTLAKGDVGLSNVDNTSDANKPVSTAQAAAIAARYGKDNILGTVSQSAGVPTGAVIERGSNVNGTYVRFADGTQICAVSSTFTEAAVVVWTYPAIFVAAPTYLSASGNHSPNPRYYLVDTATTGGNVSATIYRSVRETRDPVVDAFLVCCTAIGRWF